MAFTKKSIYRFEPKIEPQTYLFIFFFSYGPTLNPQIKEMKKEHVFENGQKGQSKVRKGQIRCLVDVMKCRTVKTVAKKSNIYRILTYH